MNDDDLDALLARAPEPDVEPPAHFVDDLWLELDGALRRPSARSTADRPTQVALDVGPSSQSRRWPRLAVAAVAFVIVGSLSLLLRGGEVDVVRTDPTAVTTAVQTTVVSTIDTTLAPVSVDEACATLRSVGIDEALNAETPPTEQGVSELAAAIEFFAAAVDSVGIEDEVDTIRRIAGPLRQAQTELAAGLDRQALATLGAARDQVVSAQGSLATVGRCLLPAN